MIRVREARGNGAEMGEKKFSSRFSAAFPRPHLLQMGNISQGNVIGQRKKGVEGGVQFFPTKKIRSRLKGKARVAGDPNANVMGDLKGGRFEK